MKSRTITPMNDKEHTMFTIVELERDAYGSALFQIAALTGLETRNDLEPLDFAESVVESVRALVSNSTI